MAFEEPADVGELVAELRRSQAQHVIRALTGVPNEDGCARFERIPEDQEPSSFAGILPLAIRAHGRPEIGMRMSGLCGAKGTGIELCSELGR